MAERVALLNSGRELNQEVQQLPHYPKQWTQKFSPPKWPKVYKNVNIELSSPYAGVSDQSNLRFRGSNHSIGETEIGGRNNPIYGSTNSTTNNTGSTIGQLQSNSGPSGANAVSSNPDLTGGSQLSINIPESFGTGAVAGTTFNIASTAIPTGVIAGSALGGLLYGIKRTQDKGLTLPGSDYIGPGNPINIDAPRNNADALAKEHDIQYTDIIARAQNGIIQRAQFIQEILNSDAKYSDYFMKDWNTHKDWNALIAAYGLKFKNLIEKKTGVIYPSFPGKCLEINNISYIQRKETIGIRLTKDRKDTPLSNINWLALEEVFLLIILFQKWKNLSDNNRPKEKKPILRCC